MNRKVLNKALSSPLAIPYCSSLRRPGGDARAVRVRVPAEEPMGEVGIPLVRAGPPAGGPRRKPWKKGTTKE